jgi:DNA repair protein RadA/Sms
MTTPADMLRSVPFTFRRRYMGVMAKIQKRYVCQSCGSVSSRWQGQCPDCSEWNTMLEEAPVQMTPLPPSIICRAVDGRSSSSGWTPIFRCPTGWRPASPNSTGHSAAASSRVGDADRRRSGIGKSTLLLQAAAKLAMAGRPVAYVSGEEAADQVRLRARRLGLGQAPVRLAAATSVRDILTTLSIGTPPALLIIDSIQTMHSDLIEGAPGTVSQVRASGQELIRFAKERGTAVVLVGHVTKDGSIAGPRVLEHMVDTVLAFEGERSHQYRILRAIKNRFGGTDEIGVFSMQTEGWPRSAIPPRCS